MILDRSMNDSWLSNTYLIGDVAGGEGAFVDAGTIFQQLGVSHDPASLAGRVTTVLLHPVTIGRALVRSLGGR